MERIPFLPFESGQEPEGSGESDAAQKKKKKPTRVPLPQIKPEQAKESKEPNEVPVEKTGTKPSFEQLFSGTEEAKTEKEKPQAAKPEELKVDEEKSSDKQDAAVKDREQSAEERTEESDRPGEGDLAETEALIFNRPEAVNDEAEAHEEIEAVDIAPDEVIVPELPVETTEKLLINPELAAEIDTEPVTPAEAPIAAEATVTPEIVDTQREEVIPGPIDYEPIASEPMPVPLRHRMLDPSERFGDGRAAEKYHTETVQPVTKEDVSDAYHRGQKRGVSRGVVAGGLAGWWLGRRGKRAEVREAAAAVASRDKEIDRLESEHAIAKERLSTIQRTQEQLASSFERFKLGMSAGLRRPESSPERASRQERTAPLISRRPEFAPRTIEKQPPLAEKSPAQQLPPEERSITEETYRAPEGRRVETSSWHRYEVDARTGKVVENPELAYGEAFRQEQQQERMKEDQAEPKLAKVGQTVLRGAAGIGSAAAGANSPSVPAATDVPKKAGKMPSMLRDTAFIKKQLIKQTSSPVTWVIALVIVVLLLLVGVL